jgi:hypothetical protein
MEAIGVGVITTSASTSGANFQDVVDELPLRAQDRQDIAEAVAVAAAVQHQHHHAAAAEGKGMA